MLGWSRQLPGLMAGIAVLVILFWQTIAQTLGVWSQSEAYRFLYLVLPVSLYIIWSRRARLARIEPKLRLWPLVPLAGFAALWLVSKSALLLVGQQVAFVGMLQCLLLVFLGGRVYVALLFPFLFLWMMVPIGDQIMPQLMSLTVSLSKLGYHLMGRDMTSDGTLLITEAGRYTIVEACSSLPFIIGNLIISLVFANLNFQGFIKRTVFILGSVPLAIFANILRIDTVVLITEVTDKSVDLVSNHILYGWVLFAAVVALEIIIGLRFADPHTHWDQVALKEPRFVRREPRRRMVATALLTSLALMAAVRTWAEMKLPEPGARTAQDCGAMALFETASLAGGPSWEPVYDGADRRAGGQIRIDGQTVDVRIVYYATETRGRELVGWPNRSADGKRWIYLDTLSGRAGGLGAMPPPTAEWLGGAHKTRRLVWTWYWADGHFTGSPVRAKLYAALGRLKGYKGGGGALLLSVAGPPLDTAARTLAMAREKLGDPRELMQAVARSACHPAGPEIEPNAAHETAWSAPDQ